MNKSRTFILAVLAAGFSAAGCAGLQQTNPADQQDRAPSAAASGSVKAASSIWTKLGLRSGSQAGDKAEALRAGKETETRGAALPGQRLNDMDFSGMDFTQADFEKAKLQNTVWVGTKIPGANFKKARLQGAIFDEGTVFYDYKALSQQAQQALKTPALRVAANFEKARLQGAKMHGVDVSRVNFGGARLSKASLQKVTAEHANFAGADLRGANLDMSNWSRANFQGARLEGAKLTEAVLHGADLSSARGLEKADLRRAVYSVFTKFPEDFSPGKHGMRLHLSAIDTPKNRWRDEYVGDLDLENARGWEKADLTGASYRFGQKFPEGFDPVEKGMVMQLEGFMRDGVLHKGFSQIGLNKGDFEGANFYNLDITHENIKHALAKSNVIQGADLSRVKNLNEWEPPEGAVFAYDLNTKFPEGFDPASKDWLKLDLSRMDLRDADLRDMDLRGVRLPSYPDLDGADLRGAHLGGQDLREAKNLEKANWDGAYIDLNTSFAQEPESHFDEYPALIRKVRDKAVLDLRNKDLKKIFSRDRKSSEDNLADQRISLWLSSFSTAAGPKKIPMAADFEGADLSFTEPWMLDLRRALNLEKANLEGVPYRKKFARSWLPENFDPEAAGMIAKD